MRLVMWQSKCIIQVASSQTAGGNERDGDGGGEWGCGRDKCHDKLMFEGTIKQSP